MTPFLIWLIAGISLCIAELFLPTTFILFNMGVAAILVAVVSTVLPFPNLLIALWVILAILGVFLSRRFFVSQRKSKNLGDAQEGETLTAILPGKTGRVLYEGNSWQAKCIDPKATIAEKESVYVLEKQGNTLIVLPYNLLP